MKQLQIFHKYFIAIKYNKPHEENSWGFILTGRSLCYMRRLFLFLSILIITLSANYLYAQDLEGLSLEECLTLALNNHPSLKRSQSSTRDIAAQLEAIRAANRATLSLTGSARYNGDFDYWEDRYNNETASLTLSKTLYDTGRNRLQQEIRKESLKGAQETERNTQVTVAANAKRAYYDLVLKYLNLNVEREKLNNLEEHLKTAQGFYDVGNSPFIEVTKAQADVATAKVSMLKAENDILVSQEALRVAMGADTEGNITVSGQLALPEADNDINALIVTALQDRPDYRKLLHDVRGSEISITNTARAKSPTITGSAGSSINKREHTSATNEYNVGININVPIIDGGAMEASLESARAQLEQVNADLESLRQQMTYSVRSAALSLMNAIDRVRSSEASVKYAEENLELARGRYEVGVGDPLELSDAVSTLATSRYTYYQALYDSLTARTNLDEALGHLPEEVSE